MCNTKDDRYSILSVFFIFYFFLKNVETSLYRDVSSFLDFAHFLLLRHETEKPGLSSVQLCGILIMIDALF